MLDIVTQNHKRTVGQWAKIIKADFGNAVESLIAAGQHLTEAKTELDHGDFLPLLERLQISKRTAQALMQIVRNPALVKSAHGAHLPASISTLALLSDSSPDLIEKWIAEGAITPELKRSDLPKAKAQPNPTHASDLPKPASRDTSDDIPPFLDRTAPATGYAPSYQSPWEAHGKPAPDDEAPDLEEANKLNRELLKFVADYCPRTLAWHKAHPNLLKTDRDAFVANIYQCAEEVMRLAQAIDGR